MCCGIWRLSDNFSNLVHLLPGKKHVTGTFESTYAVGRIFGEMIAELPEINIEVSEVNKVIIARIEIKS